MFRCQLSDPLKPDNMRTPGYALQFLRGLWQPVRGATFTVTPVTQTLLPPPLKRVRRSLSLKDPQVQKWSQQGRKGSIVSYFVFELRGENVRKGRPSQASECWPRCCCVSSASQAGSVLPTAHTGKDSHRPTPPHRTPPSLLYSFLFWALTVSSYQRPHNITIISS